MQEEKCYSLFSLTILSTIKLLVLGCEEWISTGLYISPGMKTYISVPPEIVGKNWQVINTVYSIHVSNQGMVLYVIVILVILDTTILHIGLG